MKISLNLLGEFIAIKQTPEELAKGLTDRAFEVEGIERQSAAFSNVICI